MVHLIEVLTQEGFLAKWQQTDDGLQLVKYHCPYYRVSQHHPEVCQIGEVLIQVAMNADVEKEACVLTGDSVCRFVLQDGS
jgi:predicted ArsR family transcriptional regulator